MADLVQQPYNMFAQQKPQVKNETVTVAAKPQPTEQIVAQPQEQKQIIHPIVPPSESQQPVITSMDDLAQAIGYTTPEQEEKMRKASVMNQRISAVGDAIRHIGNIANTVNYAPAQQLNNPVLEEQARYEKSKALRDRANQIYLNYQQKKAAQDFAQKKWEQEYALKQADDERKSSLNDARISRYNAMSEKDAANKAYWETRARLLEEGWPLDKAVKEANAARARAQANLANTRAANGGYSSGGGRGGKGMDEYTVTKNTTYNYDENGRRTGSTSTTERVVNGKKQPTQTTKTQAASGSKSGNKKTSTKRSGSGKGKISTGVNWKK
jgi:hypothetical protein